MSRTFPEAVEAAVRARGCPLVVGLDPRPDKLPRALCRGIGPAQAVLAFCERILDLVAPLVPAVKPQIAFFETLGHEGFRAYERVCAGARARGLVVIGDVKRGDIGSTAEAYAAFHLGLADAVTVHPLLGSDSLAPFLRLCRERARGLFVLVRTSNPSSVEFQDLRTGEGTLSEHIARAVDRWGREVSPDGDFAAVGAVVGATWPQQLVALRSLMPRALILLPGIGAQGGRIDDVRGAFDAQGRGGLVTASRAATECFEPDDQAWEEKVLAAVRALRAESAQLLSTTPRSAPS